MGKKLRRAVLPAAALCLAAVTLFCAIHIETEDWIIRSERLPEAFDGLRITLLTDVHGSKRTKPLVEAVAESEPDLIAVSGDLVDEFSDLSMLEPLLTGLAEIAPVYYVTGNHEWARKDTETVLKTIAACGVTVLRNETVLLTRDEQSVMLVGIEDKNAYADMKTPAQVMEQVPQETFSLVLYHRNDSLDLWAELQADAVLAGHGHGGLVRLPFVGGLLGVDRTLFPDDCEGLYEKNGTVLAVSRGAGGARLWNRPHIPTIVLRSVPET